MHSIKIHKLATIILKLGLVKTYDMVGWSFLRLILLQKGVSLEATNWILGWVSSTNYVVLINGRLADFLKSSRGLRHGCPLSPSLFLLVIEGLCHLIFSYKSGRYITGVKVWAHHKLTHSLFVDDVLLFCSNTLQECVIFHKLLKVFC